MDAVEKVVGPFPLSWSTDLVEEFEKPYWKKLQQYIFEERVRYKVFPPNDDVFAALHMTSYQDVKILILGQDPYHGEGQAHGLCFSVKKCL